MITEAENRNAGQGAGTTAGSATGQAMDTGTGNKGGGTAPHGTGDRTHTPPRAETTENADESDIKKQKGGSGEQDDRTETEARRSAGSGPGQQNPAGTKK